MIIVYVDIVLLIILLCLTLFALVYCWYSVRQLQRDGQVTILLKSRNVLFSHKNEDSIEELRAVVAYQNPFTGDYCVRKSSVGPHGYLNPVPPAHSPDSGLSDEYEPLRPPPRPGWTPPHHPASDAPSPPDGMTHRPPVHDSQSTWSELLSTEDTKGLVGLVSCADSENSVNHTWNWNYTEYQI